MIIMFILQRRMIYYPMSLEKAYEFPPYVPGMEEVYMTCDDGTVIHGLWAPGKEERPCVLIFHGNAGNVIHREVLMQGFNQRGYSVCMIDYHGYGKSGGKPTEQNLYMDGRTAIAWLSDVQGIPPERIVIFAKSLGSGVGVEMAVLFSIKGLILESPFSSTSSVARSHFVYSLFPTGLLIRDKYDNISKISSIGCPVMFIHGSQDNLISRKESDKLFEKAKEPKTLYIIEGAGHNDVQFIRPMEYWNNVSDWIMRTQSAKHGSRNVKEKE
jgi:fermentation-respiration switch protein FrsA (DUF1100 family)